MRTVSVLLILCSSLSLGQIPNAGFEFWATDVDTNTNPVGWETTNSYPIVNVDPVTGCQGSYAMRVATVDAGFAFPGVATLQTAYTFSEIPTRLSACIRSNIMPGDGAYIIVALMSGDSIVASPDSCTFHIDSTISTFTYHEFPIASQSTLVPDSIVIIVASGLGSGQVGTEVIIDELEFLGPAAVSDERALPASFSLHQNYPNPFNPGTVIRYMVPVTSLVTLKVYNALGQEVETLVNGQVSAGTYSVNWNAAGFPSGVYFARLEAGEFRQTIKVVLMK